MLLSATPEGKAWLAQFDKIDQDLAALFINSLRLISSDEIENSIQAQLESIQRKAGGPVALYAAREIVRGEDYFPEDKDEKPTHIAKNRTAGSEGRVAHLIRAMSSSKNKALFHDHPSLNILANKKIRTLVIVDDVSYTGNRLATFINGFTRNKTISSWLSGKAVEIAIVTCASTRRTEATLRRRLDRTKRGRFKVWPRLLLGESLTKSSLPQSFRGIAPRLSELMQEYGRRGKVNPDYYNGYSNTSATVIPAYRCPNNAPGILWYQTNKWRALFPDRAIPSDLRKFFTLKIHERPTFIQLLAASPSLLVHFMNTGAARRVKLLRLLEQGHRRVFALAGGCGISHSYTRRLLVCMRDEGLIGPHLSPAGYGLEILKKFQGHETLSEDVLRESQQRLHLQEFYFPRTLKTTRRVL